MKRGATRQRACTKEVWQFELLAESCDMTSKNLRQGHAPKHAPKRTQQLCPNPPWWDPGFAFNVINPSNVMHPNTHQMPASHRRMHRLGPRLAQEDQHPPSTCTRLLYKYQLGTHRVENRRGGEFKLSTWEVVLWLTNRYRVSPYM
jgi:hypothetical protein